MAFQVIDKLQDSLGTLEALGFGYSLRTHCEQEGKYIVKAYRKATGEEVAKAEAGSPLEATMSVFTKVLPLADLDQARNLTR